MELGWIRRELLVANSAAQVAEVEFADALSLVELETGAAAADSARATDAGDATHGDA